MPFRVGKVREDETAALHAIDDFAGDALPERRTPPASAEPAVRSRGLVAHIWRAVHHDPALQRVVVESGFQPIQTKRVSILADVHILRLEEPEARLVRVGLVREAGWNVLAAALAVRDELVIEQAVRAEIED